MAKNILCLSRVFFVTLFYTGVVLLLQRLGMDTPSFAKIPASTQFYSSSSAKPVKIYIPKLKLNLRIETASISDGRWPLSDDALIHLQSTPNPVDSGNTVIYGHNWPQLLGSVDQLSPGDYIYVSDEAGQTHSYTLHSKGEVSPLTLGILDNTLDGRLTLFTCSGFLDQSRLVLIALPTKICKTKEDDLTVRALSAASPSQSQSQASPPQLPTYSLGAIYYRPVNYQSVQFLQTQGSRVRFLYSPSSNSFTDQRVSYQSRTQASQD